MRNQTPQIHFAFQWVAHLTQEDNMTMNVDQTLVQQMSKTFSMTTTLVVKFKSKVNVPDVHQELYPQIQIQVTTMPELPV
jgi:hypothetical protein